MSQGTIFKEFFFSCYKNAIRFLRIGSHVIEDSLSISLSVYIFNRFRRDIGNNGAKTPLKFPMDR